MEIRREHMTQEMIEKLISGSVLEPKDYKEVLTNAYKAKQQPKPLNELFLKRVDRVEKK